MGNRSRRPVAVALIVAMLVGVVAALAGGTPAAAAPQPFQLDLVEGELLIRDAEEPYALGASTAISGEYDTGDEGSGAISDGTFSSPTISFETVALGQQVFVDATFSQVVPGSGTGSIDADGNMSFRTELTVDLHIEVNDPPTAVQECRSTPVAVALDSTSAYDPETKQVTLRDADFTVPPVPVTDTCISVFADNVNALLAGGGHSLTMAMEGDLVLPPPAGCPTTTSVAVTPEASFLGDDVTLAATVTPAPDGSPECEGTEGVVPTGSVEFLADGVVVGVSDLDGSATAQVVTDDLPTGALEVVARYRPQPPYSASSSTAVTHVVSPRPSIEVDMPSGITVGAAPVEFTVTMSNPGIGTDLANVRLDATFAGTPAMSPVLERLEGDTWVPITVSFASTRRFAALMPLEGIALPVGAEVTRRFRISTAPTQAPSRVIATFELVPVDPEGTPPAPVAEPAPNALARARVDTLVVNSPRRTATLNVTPVPHTLRQGMAPRIQTSFSVPSGGPPAQGTFEVLLDGEPVPIRGPRSPVELGYQLVLPVRDLNGGVASPKFVLPPTTRTGTREVTVLYSGDPIYLPAQATTTITVLPRQGQTFACRATTVVGIDLINMNVVVSANLPSVARPGEPIPLSQLAVSMVGDRGDGVASWANVLPASLPVLPPGGTGDGLTNLTFGLGDAGSATAASVAISNDTTMTAATRPVDPNPNMSVEFDGEVGQVTPPGAPGDTVEIALETIAMTASLFNGSLSVSLSCTPLGDPIVLGTVALAGTSLAIEAPSPTREGDAVTLRAQVAPAGTAGTVEFLDGEESVAIVGVASDGRATYTTDDLDVGEHSLRARFRTSAVGASSISSVVPLTIIDRYDCPAGALPGAAATTRLGYMVLADRCPTAGELEYWIAQQEASGSHRTLVRTLARSMDLAGLLVGDGYAMVLDRAPDDGGREYWAQQLLAGYGYQRLLASLAASPEFYAAAGGTDEGYVDALYDRILLRAPEPDGRAYWIGRLAAGDPRWQVALAFTGVPELRERLVGEAYERVFDRAPSAIELADDSEALRVSRDLLDLYGRLASRPEFADRAQDLPNLP